MLGGISQEGQANLLDPQQQQFLSSILGSQTGAGQQAYSDFLQQYSPEQYEQFYQKSFIDPAQQVLQRQIIPGIKENFMGLDESASGGLNRALAQAASDVSTNIGSGMMNQYNVHQQNRMGALGGLQGLLGQRAFQPLIRQSEGLLPGIISALGNVGGGLAGRKWS